jgi:group I intron endonuclease
MSIGIYKIQSPSGKKYIGQSVNIEERWRKYKKLSCKRQPKIYNSLKKYGPENHIFEIIEECLPEYLNERELYWKLYYNSINEGLNCELFDIGQGYRDEKTKQKISKSLLGKSKTKEHCLNLSKSKIGTPSKRKGKPDLKQKGKPKPGVSEKTKGKPKTGAGPKTGKYILHTDTGEIFSSVKQCMEKFGFHKKQMYIYLNDKNSKFKKINKNEY